jgi:Putative DNA-binding domain
LLLEFQRNFAAAIGSPAKGPMRVYRNTVLSGCVDALRCNYPIVARLLGDEMFETVAAEHVAKYPPRRPSLALYGACFPDWLEEQPWIWDVAYVPDVARVERLYIEALFAADADPLELSDVSGCDDWQNLHLTAHPATRFDWLTMPATTIWLAQRNDAEGGLDVEWRPEGVFVTRPGMQVETRPMDHAAHRFMFGICQGESVGDAAIATGNLYPQADIGPLFTSVVNAGAFAALPNRSLP